MMPSGGEQESGDEEGGWASAKERRCPPTRKSPGGAPLAGRRCFATSRRRHPLHVAGTDDATVPHGVPVLHLSLERQGYGLKAPTNPAKGEIGEVTCKTVTRSADR